MIVRKRVYRRRPARKGKSVRKAVRKAVRKVKDAHIKAVVNRVIGRQAETKVLQSAGAFTCRSIQQVITQTQFDNLCFMCTPQGGTIGAITQQYPILGNGIGNDQRIGDECKIKAHYINYIVNALPYNATTNPTPQGTIVQVWVVTPKTGQRLGLAGSSIGASTASNFFEYNNDAESGMVGNLYDKLRKVDRDNYRVLAYREHKIGWAGVLNTTNNAATLQNNDFKQYATGRIKLPGYNLKFDRIEGLQRIPTYMFVQVMAADGTVYPTATIPVGFRFNQAIYFTDL